MGGVLVGGEAAIHLIVSSVFLQEMEGAPWPVPGPSTPTSLTHSRPHARRRHRGG